MNLLLGLGNPGKTYENTRHNVGRDFIEYCIHKMNEMPENSGDPIQINEKNKLRSFVAEVQGLSPNTENIQKNSRSQAGDKTIFAIPTTYMNNSGESAVKLMSFYKIPKENLTLVYDDLDLPFNTYKITQAKGPKDHNGVNSVTTALSSNEFTHIRIGIDNRSKEDSISGRDYVLQRFTQEELDQRNELFGRIYKEVFESALA